MEVCVESFFLQKGDKNVIEFCNRTFDADTHRLKEQTKTCFSHASSREEDGVGVFFWRYASVDDDDDDALLLFSLSSRFEDDDDSFSSTTANHRKRKKFLSRELESNFSTPAPLALLEEDVERKVFSRVFVRKSLSLFLSPRMRR